MNFACLLLRRRLIYVSQTFVAYLLSMLKSKCFMASVFLRNVMTTESIMEGKQKSTRYQYLINLKVVILIVLKIEF